METSWTVQDPGVSFVNKMDQAGTDRERVLAELKKRFGDHCIDFEKCLEVKAVKRQQSS